MGVGAREYLFVDELARQLRLACLDEIDAMGEEQVLELFGLLPAGLQTIRGRSWSMEQTMARAAALRVDIPTIVQRVFDSIIWMPSCTAVGNEHAWVQMHHVKDGIHWCPTGFMWCSNCAGTRVSSEGEDECQRWGEA